MEHLNITNNDLIKQIHTNGTKDPHEVLAVTLDAASDRAVEAFISEMDYLNKDTRMFVSGLIRHSVLYG